MGKRTTIIKLEQQDDLYTIIRKVNRNLNALNQYTTNVDTKTGGGGSGGVKSHQDLIPESCLKPDCHSTAAITGLDLALTNIVDALDTKADKTTVPSNYIKTMFWIGMVISTTRSSLPSILTSGMTWNNIGQQTIGSKTVHFYERTA